MRQPTRKQQKRLTSWLREATAHVDWYRCKVERRFVDGGGAIPSLACMHCGRLRPAHGEGTWQLATR